MSATASRRHAPAVLFTANLSLRSALRFAAGLLLIAWLRRKRFVNFLYSYWRLFWLRRCWLKVSSTLRGSGVRYQRPGDQHNCLSWGGSCPCCRRPLKIEPCQGPHALKVSNEAKGKCAYVITLWGASQEYVLGAMVLGHSIQATGTPHALVCLHTGDLPAGFVALLSKIWDCRKIEHVQASKNLSWSEQADRFEHVFTKLRGLELIEFEKIIMMDIDTMVLSNVDELFDLPAPAAMKRGMCNDRYGLKHGDALDGTSFFGGRTNSKYSWGQGTGINAGVMLWQPNEDVVKDMLAEVADDYHPAHIRGNGPEQDFLSRYWADSPWTHIGVEYNYQLHQMFFSLNPYVVHSAERAKLAEDTAHIKIVHYSGEPTAKPWHRVLDKKFSHLWPDRAGDAAYVDIFAEEFRGWWLFVRRDRSAWDKIGEDNNSFDPCRELMLGLDNQIYQVRGPSWNQVKSSHSRSVEDTVALEEFVKLDIPESSTRSAMEILRHSLSAWFDAFEALQTRLGIDIVAALREAAPAQVSLAEAGLAQSWKPGWFARPRPQEEATSRAAAPLRAECARSSSSSSQPRGVTPVPARIKYRIGGGWLYEEICSAAGAPSVATQAGGHETNITKASVVCCASDEAQFVVFNDPSSGCEPIFPDGVTLKGLFVKVLGRPSRSFSLQDGDVSPVEIWAEGVNVDEVVMIACIDLDSEILGKVLRALEILGVPQGPICADFRALAAAGSTSSASGFTQWNSAHASTDAAYASVPVLVASASAPSAAQEEQPCTVHPDLPKDTVLGSMTLAA